MSGGGKGGSQSTQVQIPAWLESAAQRNIGRAEELAQIGFTPYYGPDVAALTPMQQSAMQNTGSAAQAFGLQSSDPMAGLPQAQDFGGGVSAYSSAPLFQAALDRLQAERPGQYAAMQAPFINPVTGAPASSPFGTASPAAVASPMTTAQPTYYGGEAGGSYGGVGYGDAGYGVGDMSGGGTPGGTGWGDGLW